MSLEKEFTIYGNIQIKICRAVVAPKPRVSKGDSVPFGGVFRGNAPKSLSADSEMLNLARRRASSASKG